RRHPDGWQGFLTQSGRIIRRQDMRGEILNRLLGRAVDNRPYRARRSRHTMRNRTFHVEGCLLSNSVVK
ncbi:MAG: hypothetical protein HFG09_07125, partial [Oscillibacter sp.]|nr:hypothetical protein [Oscillibacter sp.]